MDESNIFIDKCTNLVNCLIEYNKETQPEMKITEVHKFFHNNKVEKPHYPKYEEYTNVLEFTKAFTKSIFNMDKKELSFMTLWEYSEFIRWCEKMFLYENNSSQNLYSDTPIDSIDTRTLVINKKGFSIIIYLKMSQKADFDNKSDKLIFHEIQEINIKRSYGKELMNKFRIIDGTVKINDSSDKLLLDLVNEIIFDTLSSHFYKIIINIDNGNFIENMMFNNRFITP